MSIYFFPLPLLIGLAMLAISLAVLRQNGSSWSYLAVFSTFWIYLMAVIGLTQFPLVLPLPGAGRRPIEYILAQVNLNPFIVAGEFHSRLGIILHMIGNFLLTVPFGFLLPRVAPMSLRKFLWFAIGIGVAIELIQFIVTLTTGVVYYHVVDINDALFNCIGAMTGYGLFRLWSRMQTGIKRFI
jgi:glycopeptide antibiotics resistance protein